MVELAHLSTVRTMGDLRPLGLSFSIAFLYVLGEPCEIALFFFGGEGMELQQQCYIQLSVIWSIHNKVANIVRNLSNLTCLRIIVVVACLPLCLSF